MIKERRRPERAPARKREPRAILAADEAPVRAEAPPERELEGRVSVELHLCGVAAGAVLAEADLVFAVAEGGGKVGGAGWASGLPAKTAEPVQLPDTGTGYAKLPLRSSGSCVVAGLPSWSNVKVVVWPLRSVKPIRSPLGL